MSTPPPIRTLNVGDRYDRVLPPSRGEGAELWLNRYGCEISMHCYSLRPDEISSWCIGGVEFGWVDCGTAAVLTMRPGKTWPHADMSYHPMRVREDHRGMPDPSLTPEMTRLEALKALTASGMPGSKDDIHIIGAADSPIKSAPKDGHLFVPMYLIHAEDNRIAAIHATTWPPRFVAAVEATIQRMMSEPYSAEDEEARLSGLYATYTPKQLHEDRAQITCIGGRD